MIVGYTAGVFDLFHIGHVNLLRNAKGMCDRLVVGVSIDEVVQYKGKTPIIPFEQRIEVVKSCRYVDAVIPQYDIDKISTVKRLHANYLFVGDDWYGDPNWKKMESDLAGEGCQVVYFPYTRNISSTIINEILTEKRA